MGQTQSLCTPEEFIEHPIFPHLISVNSINKTIMRSGSQQYFDSEGYPIGQPTQPIWFTDEDGIYMYLGHQQNNILKKYKFKKDTNYNLINVTNVLDPNDFGLLTDINQNIRNKDKDKLWLNRDLIKSMVDCVIRKLKNSGEMNSNGQITTKIYNFDKTITEQQLTAIYKERGKDTLVEIYLFTKLFEELDNYGILDEYNIIGFYNGKSGQEDGDILPSEIVILHKYVRDCMNVFEEDRMDIAENITEPIKSIKRKPDDEYPDTKRRKRGGSKKRRRRKTRKNRRK